METSLSEQSQASQIYKENMEKRLEETTQGMDKSYLAMFLNKGIKGWLEQASWNVETNFNSIQFKTTFISISQKDEYTDIQKCMQEIVN